MLGCQPPPKVVGDDGWGPQLHMGAEPLTPPPPPAPRSRTIPPDKRKRWARADEIASLTALPGRDGSEHEGGGLERKLLINELARGYRQLASRQPLPVGAVIVQQHFRLGSDKRLSLYVMFKQPAGTTPTTHDWGFVVLDAALRVAASGPIDGCVRCHLESPFDAVFGPPQEQADTSEAQP
jgi:hypothetical protein